MQRIVTVGKDVIVVECGPRTPLSEVLYRAAAKVYDKAHKKLRKTPKGRKA